MTKDDATYTKKQCDDPRCGSFGAHTYACRTHPAEHRYEETYQALQRLRADMKRRLQDKDHTIQRLKEQVTLWQGKYRIVCTENNALRKKL